jgi:hypothetical protein
MSNPAMQNEALKSIAEDATSAGATDVVTKALDEMTNAFLRDDVAASCALRIAKRDPKNATTIAERIANPARKNDVLGKIAKGG